jgi:protein gp37
MAEITGIAWTDSTFNPWWGCLKVGPECSNCYAENLDTRTGGNYWGVGSKPRAMSNSNWNNPVKWQKKAAAANREHKVFCGSMCDWCDKNAPEGQRDRLWEVIRNTPNLSWQLLTKRAPNIKKYLPEDWKDGYDNVWLGVSCGDRKHGLRRVDVLRDIPAKVRFLSVEPLLEDLGKINLEGIHWVIVGGESGPGCRPMKIEWVRSIKEQCEDAGVAFFYKQRGGHPNASECLIEGIEIKEFPLVA